jgi:hypothetical protein
MEVPTLHKLLDHPLLLIIAIALGLSPFLYFAPKLNIDISADSLVLKDDPDLAYYRAIQAEYGTQESLIVAYQPRAELFSRKTLGHLKSVKSELEQLESISGVTSIFDVPLLETEGLSLYQLATSPPTLQVEQADYSNARQELRSSPLYANRLLSEDATTTAIQLIPQVDDEYLETIERRNALLATRLDDNLSSDQRHTLQQLDKRINTQRDSYLQGQADMVQQVRQVLAKYREDTTLFLGGVPMIVTDMMRYIRDDLVVFGLSVLGMLVLVLGWIFRHPVWVLIPIVSATAVALITTGFLGMTRWPVTVVSSNYLALLLIFTFSLLIHLIVRYRELARSDESSSQRELVVAVIKSKLTPCVFTTLTTMVAFASLVFSDLKPVIDFGWIMVIALAAGLVIAFTLFPAVLSMLRRINRYHHPGLTAAFTQLCSTWVNGRPRSIILLFLFVAVFSAYGLSRLSVENRFIDYFHEETEIFQGMQLIDAKLGGTTPLDVIIDAPASEMNDSSVADDAGFTAQSYWYNSLNLKQVKSIHDYLDGLSQTGKVLSLYSSLEALKPVDGDILTDDFFLSVLYKRLPDENRAQLISPFLSADGDQLRIAIRLHERKSDLNRQALFQSIRQDLQTEFDIDSSRVRLTGMAVLYDNVLQSLFSSQIKSLGIVLAAVAITFALLFRSFRVAGIAVIANIISVMFVLGCIGLVGIPLDIMTITIAAITLGMAVDNTIHFIHRHREEWEKSRNYAKATAQAHASVGYAMTFTTLCIVAGFIVMTLSNFMPTVYFGLFTSLAMGTALLIDLLLLPALLATFRAYGDA